jgi:hypothetical protein
MHGNSNMKLIFLNFILGLKVVKTEQLMSVLSFSLNFLSLACSFFLIINIALAPYIISCLTMYMAGGLQLSALQFSLFDLYEFCLWNCVPQGKV